MSRYYTFIFLCQRIPHFWTKCKKTVGCYRRSTRFFICSHQVFLLYRSRQSFHNCYWTDRNLGNFRPRPSSVFLIATKRAALALLFIHSFSLGRHRNGVITIWETAAVKVVETEPSHFAPASVISYQIVQQLLPPSTTCPRRNIKNR